MSDDAYERALEEQIRFLEAWLAERRQSRQQPHQDRADARKAALTDPDFQRWLLKKSVDCVPLFL